MTGTYHTTRLRHLAAVIVILAAFILPHTASALTRRDATTVLDVIERLQPTFGRFAYSEEIADDWFERDAEGDRVIAKAGFSGDSWRTALREIYCGYLATLPDAGAAGHLLRPEAGHRADKAARRNTEERSSAGHR
jgi:hypothetical protein